MGQQQLLLIVLGVIIVGIAIVVGINLFNANAVSANRDAVVADLNNLGAMAHQYYLKPTSMGGGGGSYANFDSTKVTGLLSTANGTYAISAAGLSSVTIAGTGTQIGNDKSTAVKATLTVKVPPLTDAMVINN